jgi:hypothetical protein
MQKLTFYEQVGIVIPGAILLFGLAYFFPPLKDLFVKDGMSVGDFGIFVLLSYAAGHLIAGLGNFGERVLWAPFGGFPSNWVVKKKSELISNEQREALPNTIQVRLNIGVPVIVSMNPKKWHPISRQIYADIELNGKRDRLEIFNGNYGLNRGLAAVCLALACVALSRGNWQIGLGLFVFCVMYIYRAYHFGVNYGRELYVQFLAMNDASGRPSKEGTGSENEG